MSIFGLDNQEEADGNALLCRFGVYYWLLQKHATRGVDDAARLYWPIPEG